MRREAFSLIETIFVIVIISIIAATGALSVRPHRVENDSRWVLMQIKRPDSRGWESTIEASVPVKSTILPIWDV
jgi:prepilin-type N-terminal cleavage/methylation domain-containing protein